MFHLVKSERIWNHRRVSPYITLATRMGSSERLKPRMKAAVNIEIQGISPFECKGNSTALAQHWKKWLQSFQYFSWQGGVNDAQKKALLFHTAGMGVQEMYETLTDPGTDTFGEDTATEYEKTVRTLDAYFVTKLNEPCERHVFRSMTQQNGETVDQFIARLRKQAQNCNFNDPMLTSEIKSLMNVVPWC